MPFCFTALIVTIWCKGNNLICLSIHQLDDFGSLPYEIPYRYSYHCYLNQLCVGHFHSARSQCWRPPGILYWIRETVEAHVITFVNQSWTACAYVKANFWSNQIAKEAIKKKRHLWVIKIYQECSSLELWRQYQWSTKTIIPLLFIQLCKHNRQNIKKKFFLCNCNYLVSCWYPWLLDHGFAVFVSSFKSWSKSSSRPLTEEKTKQETNVTIASPSIFYPPFFCWAVL